MKLGKALAVTALLATIWGVTFMHDRAHRYDIVVAGAGSGAIGPSGYSSAEFPNLALGK